MQDFAFPLYVVLWLGLFTLNLTLTWRRRQTVGLVATFLFVFLANNWLASALQALPWGWNSSTYLTTLGLQQSLAGMVGLTVGLLLLAPRLVRRMERNAHISAEPKDSGHVLSKGIFVALAVGLAASILSLMARDLRGSAVISTMLNALQQLVLLAMCLLSYKLFLAKSVFSWMVVLGAAALFPVAGLVSSGIASVGATASVLLIMFYLSCRGLEKRTVLLLTIAAYLGLSLFVPYMRSRDAVRSDVTARAPFTQRVDSASLILEDATPFSLSNTEHINLVIVRLDNNAIVGAAVLALQNGIVPYALGSSFLSIPVALVPRAIWSNKPSLAGGSRFVTYYTGIVYNEETSAGVGPVLEGYANFGTVGVFALFMLFGIALVIFDAQSHAALRQGNIQAFSIWFLTGTYLVNPSDFLATVVAGMASMFLILRVAFWATGVARRQRIVH
jgi:hypothetical protein